MLNTPWETAAMAAPYQVPYQPFDGRMPPPKRINNRTIWDRKRLDESFDALDDGGINPWDDESSQ